jgi:hypothetical protein
MSTASDTDPPHEPVGRGDEDVRAWASALTPLTSRSIAVLQAVGFVGAGLGLSANDALALLHQEARSESLDLADLARDILARRRPLPAPDARELHE